MPSEVYARSKHVYMRPFRGLLQSPAYLAHNSTVSLPILMIPAGLLTNTVYTDSRLDYQASEWSFNSVFIFPANQDAWYVRQYQIKSVPVFVLNSSQRMRGASSKIVPVRTYKTHVSPHRCAPHGRDISCSPKSWQGAIFYWWCMEKKKKKERKKFQDPAAAF